MATISRFTEYDAHGNVAAHRTITRQTYAVPTRYAGTALNMVTARVSTRVAMGTHICTRVVGTGSTDPYTGKPEVLVEVTGDERAHSLMLAHFSWMGW